MKIEWTCGYYVGPEYWKFSGDWVKEPDECGNVFVTEIDEDEWNECDVYATCPKCGAELSKDWDEYRILEDENDQRKSVGTTE